MKALFKKDTYNNNILLWRENQEYEILEEIDGILLQDEDENNLNVITKIKTYKIKTDNEELPVSFIDGNFIPDTFELKEENDEEH